MTRITLGPFNRVEGDLEITLEAEDGRVHSARVNAPLFRGFENLMVGRSALDALAIVPRICGICSVAQSIAAARALAQIGGITPTPNGQLAHQLMLSTENLNDHLTHFYLSFLPDFTRPVYAGHAWHAQAVAQHTPVHGLASSALLTARSQWLKVLGLLAGRWPHSLAMQPGGSTRALTAVDLSHLRSLLRGFRHFLETRLFGDKLENVQAIQSLEDLDRWRHQRTGDLAWWLTVSDDLGLDRMGRAWDQFLSVGHGDLHRAGVWLGGTVHALQTAHITEDVHHAWLSGAARQPMDGLTEVQADKAGAYSWCKAPRYDGLSLETGALARQLMAGQGLFTSWVQSRGASVTARVMARLYELAQTVPAMEAWVAQIQLGEPFCVAAQLPSDGQGEGLAEAARGSLGHWVEVRQGRISRYQIIAPTTWNFSPRDAQGQPGPLERALEGLPTGEGARPDIQHVLRSFDPCMVCTVH